MSAANERIGANKSTNAVNILIMVEFERQLLISEKYKHFESLPVKVLRKLAISLLFIVLVLIAIYKLYADEATPHVMPLENSNGNIENKDPMPLKDPFKEALEKQTFQNELKKDQNLNDVDKVTQSKDPFKDFLDKQSKDLSHSKVSPFGMPK